MNLALLVWVCLKLLHVIYKPGLQGCIINLLLVYGDLFGFRGAVTCIHHKSCSEKKRALFWLFSFIDTVSVFPPLSFSLSPVVTVHCDKANISKI